MLRDVLGKVHDKLIRPLRPPLLEVFLNHGPAALGLRLSLNNLENSRKSLARVLRLYAANKIPERRAKALAYIFEILDWRTIQAVLLVGHACIWLTLPTPLRVVPSAGGFVKRLKDGRPELPGRTLERARKWRKKLVRAEAAFAPALDAVLARLEGDAAPARRVQPAGGTRTAGCRRHTVSPSSSSRNTSVTCSPPKLSSRLSGSSRSKT